MNFRELNLLITAFFALPGQLLANPYESLKKVDPRFPFDIEGLRVSQPYSKELGGSMVWVAPGTLSFVRADIVPNSDPKVPSISGQAKSIVVTQNPNQLTNLRSALDFEFSLQGSAPISIHESADILGISLNQPNITTYESDRLGQLGDEVLLNLKKELKIWDDPEKPKIQAASAQMDSNAVLALRISSETNNNLRSELLLLFTDLPMSQSQLRKALEALEEIIFLKTPVVPGRSSIIVATTSSAERAKKESAENWGETISRLVDSLYR